MTKGLVTTSVATTVLGVGGDKHSSVFVPWPQLWKATEDKALAGRKSWEVVQSRDGERGFPAWVP